ncbi:hypothetical protein ACFL2U_00440 [Patescibacteria group bacterium]
MIEISLYLLLGTYAVLVVIFLIFAIINLYHLLAFGFISFESFFMTFIFVAGIILVLFITYKLGLEIDWAQSITL